MQKYINVIIASIIMAKAHQINNDLSVIAFFIVFVAYFSVLAHIIRWFIKTTDIQGEEKNDS